jgi:hypothetical protein
MGAERETLKPELGFTRKVVPAPVNATKLPAERGMSPVTCIILSPLDSNFFFITTLSSYHILRYKALPELETIQQVSMSQTKFKPTESKLEEVRALTESEERDWEMADLVLRCALYPFAFQNYLANKHWQ